MRRAIWIALLALLAVMPGAAQRGPGANATSLQGTPVAATAPTNGQALTYSSSSGDWQPGSGGSAVTLQTNGTNNSSQAALNLVAGANVTLSNTSGGNVSIASSGGSASLPVVLPETYGAVHDGAYYFDGAITGATNAATGSSTSPATPAIATAINGSVVNYAWQTQATWSAAPTVGTSQVNVDFPGAGQYGLAVNDQIITTAGDVGSASGTLSSSSVWDADAVILTPDGTIANVGTATSAHESGDTDAVVAVPTGAATGDMLVAQVAYYGGTGVVWPDGWTVLFTQQGTDGSRIAAGYIVLGASPPSTYTWTGPTGRTVGVVAYSGVKSVYALSTLSSAAANFTSGSVGDPICTADTASDGKGEQCGGIAGYISSTEVFVDYIAGSEPTNIWFGFGTDDSAAFMSMLTSAPCSTVGCRVQLGPYGYALTQSYTLPPNITQQIQGAGAGIPNTTNSYKNGAAASNANTGSRLMFLTTSLSQAAITIGGTAGVTSVAAWDQLADLSIIGGAGLDGDGGGADALDILNWQDATVHRVIAANFAGRGAYVDGMVGGGTMMNYISVVDFNGFYPIWNHGVGVQVGSSNGVSNVETVDYVNGISEGNGGPGVKVQGNVQGLTVANNIIQWNNTVSPSGASELEIDNDLASGCVIEANYFEVDDGDTYGITPGKTGCTVSNNYIAGNASPYDGHTGINTTTPGAKFTVGGNIVSAIYAIGYSATPAMDVSASNTQQFTCTAAGASLVPTVTGFVAGEVFTVIFVQNGTTACTWTWPSAIHGGGTVAATLGGISTQQFIVSANGTDAYATSAMQSTTGGTP